ncbi:tRNA1(Val) (adenine(37)-N6)-methyltransferase [Roseobacter sp. HKCCA0434]|uniref:tRNA1(Val) (adenine(37)-N6)-methyltransferase n=1 Tax=Roseobacter sp. HKCCA0434 TaxID=3079297 RepID=UPI002905B0A8|nr:methyltransferase domain-containing protein [Roseobacter sp. HKCCA0434]
MTGFAPEDLTEDAFLGGRVTLRQPRHGYRAATDPVLLAAACPARAGDSVLELGCGAGTALACLAARVAVEATGLELQPDYAALARLNLPGTEIVEGDLADMPAALRALQFHHVIANPPYYGAHDLPPRDAGRRIAHVEDTPLATWIDAGLRRLRARGTLTMIHRAERLAPILAALDGRAGDIRVLPLTSRAGRAAERVIVQGRKDARGPLRLLPPFVLHAGDRHEGDGADFTEKAEAVLRHAAPLDLAAI